MKIRDQENWWRLIVAKINLAAARRLQRLRRIDVEKCAIPLDRDLRHRLVMLGNEMTGADVAIERHQFIEETARPHNGIAATASADWHRDQIAAIRGEGLDQAVDQIG